MLHSKTRDKLERYQPTADCSADAAIQAFKLRRDPRSPVPCICYASVGHGRIGCRTGNTWRPDPGCASRARCLRQLSHLRPTYAVAPDSATVAR
ncbi:hypothetical protein F01_400065 [Burkholderia cenocepacia]|nr:hypothetical protein F01_400065 [Burkholderia cenocepacia]